LDSSSHKHSCYCLIRGYSILSIMSPPLKTALWSPQRVTETNTVKFINYVNQKYGLSLQTYDHLYEWSVGDKTLAHFWTDAYNWLDLSPSDNGSKKDLNFTAKDTSNILMFPPPKFFPAATLNIAEMIFRGRKDTNVAIVFSREDATHVERVTWEALRERVRKLRSALINSGIVSGDVVAAVISNSVDAIAICLATLSIGAVWSSTSCDMGVSGITDRYAQIQPKIVFADQGYVYAGKTIDLNDRIGQWSRKLRKKSQTLEQVVLIPNAKLKNSCSQHVKSCTMEQFLNGDRGDHLLFELVPFSHPAFILFSSGTVCLTYSTLFTRWGVSVFGTSPRYLSTLKSLGIVPSKAIVQQQGMVLRIMLSTGSVLSAELYEWFYVTAFPPSAQLISMSGGTDIAGSFVCGTPLLPVYSGEIQCKALGMAVDVYDSGTDKSVSVEESGAPGELVCKRPFPSQPIAFLGEKGAQQYKASYFERCGPTVWCQGDFVQRSPTTGGIIMLGRSDGVLNPSGVRFGSAEIYAVTETIPEILDSICVGQKREIDANERVLLFVKMKPGNTLTSNLESRISVAIRDRYSPRHVPAHIFEVDEIPYTANGKKCEVNVKNVVNGHKFAVAGTVANPWALRSYEKYRDLPTEEPKVPSVISKL
ncbi:hypothetical protein KAF25_001988, partial [Fusarium avenaceum]